MQTALEFKVVEVPAQTFAYVVRRVAPGEAGEFIRGAIGRVSEFAVDHGGAVGPPFAVSSAPDDEGSLVIEAGWPVPAGTTPQPPIEVRRLPPTRAIVHRHVGPYEELGSAFYAELFSQAHDEGFTPVAGPRERYLSDPAARGEPVTEIVWPIA